MIEIIQGDCLDVLRGMADSSVDAVVTDPPYCSGGVSETGRRGAAGQGLRSSTIQRFGWFKADNMGTSGLVWLLRSIAFESIRIMRDGGSLVVFCDWRMFANVAPAIESAGLRFQNLIVWDKEGMGLGNGFRNQHELVLHFTKGAGSFHNKGTGNVLKSKRVHHTDREHQTQKPVDLMAQILRVVCPPGGTVLDPFAGSGTTLVAAQAEGMNAIGIEREAEYVEIIRARVAKQEAA